MHGAGPLPALLVEQLTVDVLNGDASLDRGSLWENAEARQVLDSMGDWFVALDRDYNIVFANKSLEEAASIKHASLVGKNCWRLWPTMRETIVEESFKGVRSTGIPTTFQYFYEPSEVWVEVSVYLAGEQLHLYFKDVTAKRKAEAELAQREASLRSLIDSIPHIAWVTDANGAMVYINAKWQEFTGVDGMVRDVILDAIHPDDRAHVISMMAHSRETGEHQPYELRLKGKDGEHRWFRVVSSSVFGADGEVTGWIGTSTDIHEQKLALEALKESEDHQRFRLNSAPQILWLADPNGTIYEQGSRWFELTGLKPEDMPEQQMSVLHPDDTEPMMQAWKHSLETGEPFELEHRIKVANGAYQWMRSMAVARRDSQGQIIRWYGASEEIHARKMAEQALRESEERFRTLAETLEALVEARTAELQAAYREQESFSYSVSHDLRAPLRAIVASAKILEEDYGDALPPEAKLILDRQAKSALRLAQLIDDLLQLSRVGRSELVRENVDLTGLFKESADGLSSNEDISFSIQPDMHAYCDPRLLNLLAQNLLENAVKFSPNGGLISVGTGPEAGSFYVADQGIGFPAQYASKLFQPFQRLHPDEDFPGTGIGLATVKRIAERHNGRVWAQSEPGKGATFFFSICP